MPSFCYRKLIRHQADIKLDNHNIYFQHRISLLLLTNFYPENTLTALSRVQNEFLGLHFFIPISIRPCKLDFSWKISKKIGWVASVVTPCQMIMHQNGKTIWPFFWQNLGMFASKNVHIPYTELSVSIAVQLSEMLCYVFSSVSRPD